MTSVTPIPSAPPEPPSPVTVATIGTARRDISRRFVAIASDTPRSSLSMPGIRAGRVDERQDRAPELLGELHDAEGLPVPLGPRHPEVAADLLLRVASLLVADDRDGPLAEDAEPGHDGRVVGVGPVAVQLDEVAEEDPHVVERERAGRVARDERLLPGGQVRVDLAGELLEPVGELPDRLVPGGALRGSGEARRYASGAAPAAPRNGCRRSRPECTRPGEPGPHRRLCGSRSRRGGIGERRGAARPPRRAPPASRT